LSYLLVDHHYRLFGSNSKCHVFDFLTLHFKFIWLSYVKPKF